MANNTLDMEWIQLNAQAKMLFTPAAPINENDLFAGRISQINRLLDAIFERGKHIILYGERGVGKTSLANTFHKRIALQYIQPIRKQCSPTDNFTSIWKEVFRSLIIETKTDIGYGNEQVNRHSISDLYNEKITPDDVVRELNKIALQFMPVIILDEFDKLSDIEAKKLMSHTMKSISDAGVNVTIILVGVANDINTLVEEHESIKRNIEEIKMPRMSHDELAEILNERLPKIGMEINEKAREKIIMLSRGLPEYVHALGKNAAISALEKTRKKIIESDVMEAVKLFLSQSEQSSNNSYKKAIHSNRKDSRYQQILLACALSEVDDEGQFTPTNVIAPLSKILQRKVTISSFQSPLSAFCKEDRGNILEKSGVSRSYKYRFREPKMQPYVLMQGMASGNIDDETLIKALSNNTK